MAYYNTRHLINAMYGYRTDLNDTYGEIYDIKFGAFNHYPTAKKVVSTSKIEATDTFIKNDNSSGTCSVTPGYSLTEKVFDRTYIFDLITHKADLGHYGARPIFLRRSDNPNIYYQVYSLNGLIGLFTNSGTCLVKADLKRVNGVAQHFAVKVKAVEISPDVSWSYEIKVYVDGVELISYSFNDTIPFYGVCDFKFEFGEETIENIAIFDEDISAHKTDLRSAVVELINRIGTATTISEIRSIASDVATKI